MMEVARAFQTAEELAQYHEEKRTRHRYGRDSSPTVNMAEYELTRWGPEPVLFSSGMAAIAALFTVARHRGLGLILVGEECYRKVTPVADRIFGQYLETRDLSGLYDVQKSYLVWVESPSNPHLKLADYAGLADLKTSRPDHLIAGDLTLAGLGNFSSEEVFDLEVHSLTKYAIGHNDAMAGVVYSRKPTVASALWEQRSCAGGIPDPLTAHLVARSLQTHDLRVEAQVWTTVEHVIPFLVDHLRVCGEEDTLFYPTMPGGSAKFHRHGGSVVSFRVEGEDPSDLTDRIGRCETVRMSPSFGSVWSMAEVPATMSGSDVEPDLVRFSVGLENPAEILKDLSIIGGAVRPFIWRE